MSQNREKKRKFDIPIWRKANLSIEEAAAYSGIGMAKLYEMQLSVITISQSFVMRQSTGRRLLTLCRLIWTMDLLWNRPSFI